MIRPENKNVVIVDDDIGMADFVSDAVEFLGYVPVVAGDGQQCLDLVKATRPACIIMDIVMPDMDGVELLKKLTEAQSSSPVIVMSGYDGKYLKSVSLIAEASGIVVLGALMKPFSVDDLDPLLAALEHGVQTRGEGTQ